MAELTVDLTYGTALYQAAAEINKEKQILEEGRAVAGILKAEVLPFRQRKKRLFCAMCFPAG